MLGKPEASTTQQALELLERGDASLYERFVSTNSNGQFLSGFCPVLISGERAPLPTLLLRGLDRGLKDFGISSSRKIRRLLKTMANDTPPQASEITDLFEAAAHVIKKKRWPWLVSSDR